MSNSTVNDSFEMSSIVKNGTLNDEDANYYQKSMEFIFEVVLLISFGVLGILGNMSAIVLFARLNNQLKFHRLMMMLSAFDTLYVVLSILLFAIPQISQNYMDLGFHHYILPKALPMAQIALTGSIYSTLAITIERYLTVCHPFYTVSSRWSARHYIIPIVSFSFLYNSPKFFELETKVTSNAMNLTVYAIEPTSIRVNQYYIQIYCIWMNFVFMGLGPFVMLIVLNLFTLKDLSGDDHDPLVRSVSNCTPVNHFSNKKNEMLLAKVSLTIVFIFILCHSVKWIPNIFELLRVTFMEDKRAWPTWVEAVTHISHFLTTFNSSVNFYVYCFKHFNVISSCWVKSDRRHVEMYSQNTSQCVRLRHRYDKDVIHLDETREILASAQV